MLLDFACYLETPKGTYDLGGSQSHLLVIVTVGSLGFEVLDAILDLLDLSLELVHGRSPAFSLDLPRLILLFELGLKLLDGLHALFEFLLRIWLLFLGDQLLVVLLELFGDLGAQLLDQERLM